MEFFHQRINKRKIGNNELGERIDIKEVREVQEEVIKKLTSEEAINTIKKLLVETKDITGPKGGTIRYKGASIQNYLTRFFLSMHLVGAQKIQQSPVEIEREIKAAFVSEKDNIEVWISGAKMEAKVINDIFSKNKSTPHLIGLNNLVDAMHAIDFFEEFTDSKTGDRILNLVQVKKMNDINKNFTNGSPEVIKDFAKMRDFLNTQEPLVSEHLKQNEISLDENFKEIMNIIDDEQKVKIFYEEKGFDYLEALIEFEDSFNKEIEKKEINTDLLPGVGEENFSAEMVSFFEEKLIDSAKKMNEKPLAFASMLQGLYYKRFFTKDFSEYDPEKNKKLDYFFRWLREWTNKKQIEFSELTKKYTSLRKKYDKIYGVYHIEPGSDNFRTDPLIITQSL